MGNIISKELIIVGGGPAGLKAGAEAKKQKIDYVILEKGKVADAWLNVRPDMYFLSPCHPQRDWTSLSDDFPIWKMDVRRPYCTAAEFVNYLDAYCDHFKLAVKTDTRVVDINLSDGQFSVLGNDHTEYRAPVLLIATGIFGNPFIPGVAGAKDNPYVMHSHYYRSRDDYKQQKVLIVGAGNSAAELAIDLCGHSMVYLVSRKDLQYFSDTRKLYHIRGISESFLKELISMELVRYRAFQEIKRIEENRVIFQDWSLDVHKIIFATGYHAHIDILRNFKLRVNKNNYPEVTDSGESIQYPNLFFAGPLSYQNTTSIVLHGFINQIPGTLARISEKLKTEGIGSAKLDNNRQSK